MQLVRNQTLARLLFWLRHKKDVHKTAFTFSNENWKSKAEAASLVPNYHNITGTAVIYGQAIRLLGNSELKASGTLSESSSGPAAASMTRAKATKAHSRWFCIFCARNKCRNLLVP